MLDNHGNTFGSPATDAGNEQETLEQRLRRTTASCCRREMGDKLRLLGKGGGGEETKKLKGKGARNKQEEEAVRS